jgi:hypothetical protein
LDVSEFPEYDDQSSHKNNSVVYKYRGIPPKLCASEAEERMLEKMMQINFSEQWVSTMGADWWNLPDESHDAMELDEDFLYAAFEKCYDNLTAQDKINLALSDIFHEFGET